MNAPVIIGDCTLYLGDCLEILPTLAAGSVDVIFADPPFNVGKPYGENGDNRNDYYEWCGDWIDLCFGALSDSGSFYLMTLDKHLPDTLPVMSKNGNFVNLIKWRNVAANHSDKQYWISTQPIAFYSKTKDFKFYQLAETRKISKENQRWGGYTTGPKGILLDYWDDIPFVYAGSIHHPEAVIEDGTNKKAHPCQMPIGLPKRAITFSSDIGDLILDPFMGSGTTGVACVQTGRKFIGIEIEERYFDIACKRIEQANRQIRMEI